MTPNEGHCAHECVCCDFPDDIVARQRCPRKACPHDTRRQPSAEHDAAIRREAYEQGVKDTKKEHREYEKCHKHFACPDGEECWYASADYYWDCGKGAAKLSEEFSRGKEHGAREERERVINEAIKKLRAPEESADNPNGWLWQQEYLIGALESLRSSKEK